MGREELQLKEAKRAYEIAKAEGNRQEEARWANVIGNALKHRGEYVKALKWFRVDYEVTKKYLPEKHLLPTCQSLGEVYLRLEDFENALTYQKKHLELAKDANDIVEQQRASTQLGRTYQEMFTRSENDHSSHHNARKYFKSALKLAENLKKNPPTYKSSFLKEYIDAVNNVGMLQKELDNLEEAEKLLTRGLDICDEEEVSEDDEGRSRLHHNLGNVYIESRMWRKALEHINKDIIICNRIGHCLGEAKGYINLGEVNYKKQKYEEAIQCYHKALALAKSMQDEDALVCQINENIKTANAAKKVMDELKKEEQNLKKLTRDVKAAKGTSRERKCLLKQDASLDCLIEKSSIISEWQKHLEFAKKKKKIASDLCDKGKLSNALLLIGESYQNLRNFDKAIKWHEKCWKVYKSLGDLEGQASAKINIGNALDCKGDWTNALDAYQEGYRIAVEANVPSSQLLALENMHYCHMIRFDNVEEARRLKAEIDKLKKSKSNDIKMQDMTRDCCSETDTEGSNQMSDSMPNAYCSHEFSKSVSGKQNICAKPTEASQKSLSSSTNSQQALVGRKRVRVVLSDDEDEMQDDVDGLDGRLHKSPYKVKSRSGSASSASNFQDIQAEPSKHDRSCCNPINIEESTCSHKCLSPKPATRYGNAIRSSSSDKAHNESDFAVSCSKDDVDVSGNIVQRNNPSSSKLCTSNANNDDLDMIKFRIDGDLIVLEAGSCIAGDKLNTESLKVELACLYYLQLPGEKRSKGLLPIIRSMKCGGSCLESLEAFKTCKNQLGMDAVEISVDGWVQKRLMKLYVDSCMEFSEKPNMKLLKKLYISEVEDEVIASECELQDISITPLLNALQTQKRVAMLDFSHNLLGNGTMEKLQQFFNSSGQKYGDLTLDLHCNRFGPTALFQICECPVLFTRLEVLNLCGNRLTDACGSYLSAILENCKALYSLNIENCSITTRTIQKVADALSGESLLAQLCIGHNQPIAGNAIIKLLEKLGNFESFSELSLNGLRLSKPVINSLCHLSKTSCLSHLMLGGTGIGTDDALCLIESLSGGARDSVKLDLSYCGLSSICIHKFNADVSVIGGILELNLGGNPIQQEGGSILASLLKNPQCCLKVLVLNKCQLGLAGTLHLIQALAENDSLEELNLADNANLDKQLALQCNSTDTVSEYLLPNGNTSKEVGIDKPAICPTNTDCNQIEVADSEDEEIKVETTTSGLGDSCANSCQKNSSMECQFVQEFSAAICMAKHLQLLDLSNNSFSTHAAEELYSAWSSREGACSTWKHIEKRTLHFSTEENKCCRLKPCCRRN